MVVGASLLPRVGAGGDSERQDESSAKRRCYGLILCVEAVGGSARLKSCAYRGMGIAVEWIQSNSHKASSRGAEYKFASLERNASEEEGRTMRIVGPYSYDFAQRVAFRLLERDLGVMRLSALATAIAILLRSAA
ncbi:hypothetical protein J3R74_002011 [Puniceicoccus vermicola]